MTLPTNTTTEAFPTTAPLFSDLTEQNYSYSEKTGLKARYPAMAQIQLHENNTKIKMAHFMLKPTKQSYSTQVPI